MKPLLTYFRSMILIQQHRYDLYFLFSWLHDFIVSGRLFQFAGYFKAGFDCRHDTIALSAAAKAERKTVLP